MLTCSPGRVNVCSMAGTAAPRGAEKTEPFDQILGRLRTVVERLEGGQLTLEESLAAFEEGVKLARQGNQVLDAAERKVEVLSRGPGGEVRSEPFASEE